MLDAVLSPEWDSRYYSFNSHWDQETALASMRDGCGDGYFILFTPAGLVIKGFARESEMSPYRVHPPLAWPGIFFRRHHTLHLEYGGRQSVDEG